MTMNIRSILRAIKGNYCIYNHKNTAHDLWIGDSCAIYILCGVSSASARGTAMLLGILDNTTVCEQELPKWVSEATLQSLPKVEQFGISIRREDDKSECAIVKCGAETYGINKKYLKPFERCKEPISYRRLNTEQFTLGIFVHDKLQASIAPVRIDGIISKQLFEISNGISKMQQV